jgi:hypothetical protein
MLKLILALMLIQQIEAYKAENPGDYAVQYAFKAPAINTDHLTYYEKMKLMEHIAYLRQIAT